MGHKLDHQKRLYDKKVNGKPFEEDDLVWLHTTVVPKDVGRKVHRPCSGPFQRNSLTLSIDCRMLVLHIAWLCILIDSNFVLKAFGCLLYHPGVAANQHDPKLLHQALISIKYSLMIYHHRVVLVTLNVFINLQIVYYRTVNINPGGISYSMGGWVTNVLWTWTITV